MEERERPLSGGASSFASCSSSASSAASSQRSERVRFLIVRHGETDSNVAGIIQGQLDTDLNARGRRQAVQVGAALATVDIDEVYTSPLRRASDTARAIVEAHPKRERLPVWFDDRFKERGFGSLEGRTYDRSKPKRDSIDGIEKSNDFLLRLASLWTDILSGPAPFRGGEKFHHTRRADYGARESDSAFNGRRSIDRSLDRGGCSRTILLVGHGAAIGALVGNVLLDTGLAKLGAGMSRTRVWNCSITELQLDLSTLEVPSHPSSSFASSYDGYHQSPNALFPPSFAIRPPPPSFAEHAPGAKFWWTLSATTESSAISKASAASGNALRGRRDSRDCGAACDAPFLIERWADVRHLPEEEEEQGEQEAGKVNADELANRAT